MSEMIPFVILSKLKNCDLDTNTMTVCRWPTNDFADLNMFILQSHDLRWLIAEHFGLLVSSSLFSMFQSSM